MQRKLICLAGLATALFALPPTAAAAMSPGLYEYSVKMEMAGAPPNMPTQTSQRCLTAKDMEGNKAYEMQHDASSDCRVRDLVQNGAQFSYNMVCTKPQKLDGMVKGSSTATSLTMDMTMNIAGMPGAMTQKITAKRLGDCKQ